MDLPSFFEFQTQLRGLKLMTLVVCRKQRQQVLQLEAQLHRIGQLVDRFYDLLGDRHWIFHEDLNTERIVSIVGPDATPESAEQGLMTMYQEPDALRDLARRLAGISALRTRLHLIDRALDDYEAGRFYATVLVLLTVMDGFVNDLDSQRRGLHTRGVDEMAAWDSVVGHHLGLSHAHRAYIKSTGTASFTAPSSTTTTRSLRRRRGTASLPLPIGTVASSGATSPQNRHHRSRRCWGH
jgi:hypothetical protein